jgi:ribose-phosphate pyrophosphokinase
VRVFYSGKNLDGKRCFPDGEIYVSLPEISKIKGRTVILHSGSPQPIEGLIELEIILNILKNYNVGLLEIFFSYFAYAQQDKIFFPGETVVSEDFIKKFINFYGVKKIYVIDGHFSVCDWVKKYPIINISALDILKREALEEFPSLMYLAPDMGSQKRNKIKGINKKRLNSFTTKFSKKNILKKVRGQNVGVIDDLVETGGTLANFYDECKKYKAKNVCALITHGVLKKGMERINQKYSKVYITNSIKSKYTNVDISNLIMKNIIKNNGT